jgi:hypothetical protein
MMPSVLVGTKQELLGMLHMELPLLPLLNKVVSGTTAALVFYEFGTAPLGFSILN